MSCQADLGTGGNEIEAQRKYMMALHKANNIMGMSLLATSMTAILLAMVVYSCFVTLQCMRVALIKNFLVVILLQEHITLVLHVLLYFARTQNLPDIRCLFRTTTFCEVIVVWSKYFELAALCWLLVLVFHQWTRSTPNLHNRFSFLRFTLVGWLTPAIPTTVWASLMARKDLTKCWSGFNNMSEIAVLEGTKLLFILVSLFFLAVNYFNLYYSRETISIDEVLKKRVQSHCCAAVWLWFVLAQVIFVSSSHASHPLDFRFMTTFSYILTVLMSTGGLVASLCLCFVDKEVWDTLSATSPHSIALSLSSDLSARIGRT